MSASEPWEESTFPNLLTTFYCGECYKPVNLKTFPSKQFRDKIHGIVLYFIFNCKSRNACSACCGTTPLPRIMKRRVALKNTLKGIAAIALGKGLDLADEPTLGERSTLLGLVEVDELRGENDND